MAPVPAAGSPARLHAPLFFLNQILFPPTSTAQHPTVPAVHRPPNESWKPPPAHTSLDAEYRPAVFVRFDSPINCAYVATDCAMPKPSSSVELGPVLLRTTSK